MPTGLHEPRRQGLHPATSPTMMRWTPGPSGGSPSNPEREVKAVSFVDSGEFGVEVEHSLPVAVVRPTGRLDAYSAPELQTALLAALSHQPAGVLVDAGGLEVVDDVGLAVLASVARESERWPGTPFAITGQPALLTAVERLGVGRFVLACPDEAAARRALGGWPAPPSQRIQIQADRDAPAVARAAVREFCQQQRVGGDRDAAELVASELVTNAVLHARTPMELTLRLVSPVLHIAVRDASAHRPRINSIVDENAESGRGLLLVDALAASWGSLVLDTGKIVWATVRVRSLSVSD